LRSKSVGETEKRQLESEGGKKESSPNQRFSPSPSFGKRKTAIPCFCERGKTTQNKTT